MDGIKVRAKTRSLKKYEAASEAGGHDEGDPPLALFSPFGPLIAQAEVPPDFVGRINSYADKRVRADASTEFLLPKDVVVDGGERSLMRQTENLIRRYLRLTD